MTLRERFEKLSARERYLLLAAGVLALVVVVYYAGQATFASLPADDDDALWVQHQKIENYRRVVERSEAASKRRKELEQRYADQQSRLMSGATPTQVGAELQGVLSGYAQAAALNVLSSQILREEEKDGFRRIGVRLTLSGSLKGVAELVAAVEGAEQDLVVSHLEINRKLSSSRRPTITRGPELSASPLTVSIEVKTFMRAES